MNAARTRFLQRRSYRQRRVADAARMLPIAGLILMLLPLLFTGGEAGETEPVRTSQIGLYIFALWVVLMATAFGLSRGLQEPKDRADDTLLDAGAEQPSRGPRAKDASSPTRSGARDEEPPA